MMNKAILFLMNGLGVEHKESYNIYSGEVMPTLDNMIQNQLFTTIQTSATDFSSAYQIFSTGSKQPLGVSFIESVWDENRFSENEKIIKFQNEVKTKNGKLHIFCFLEDERMFDHLKAFVQSIELNPEQKIFVHVALTNDSITDYRKINKMIYKFNYDSMTKAKIGSIVGANVLLNPDKETEFIEFQRLFFKGTGEKWPEIERKLETLYDAKIAPNDARCFYVRDGFTLKENDSFLIFNYEDMDCKKLIDGIITPPSYFNLTIQTSTFSFYSLFPFKNNPSIPFFYDTLVSEDSMSKALEQANLSALIFAEQKEINDIYFMCNGLSNKGNNRIQFAAIDNGILNHREQMESILKNPAYPLIIINHRIDDTIDVEQMKKRLTEIDQNLSMIKGICSSFGYPLFVSSLFGIKKEILDPATREKVLVDFSSTVPLVVVDPSFDFKNYRLGSGTTYTLLGTCLKKCNPEMKFPTVIKKKDFMTKLLFKK